MEERRDGEKEERNGRNDKMKNGGNGESRKERMEERRT